MYSEDVLTQISRNLAIKRGQTESLDAWYSRLIYSALGKIALSSLWDSDEVSDLTSVQHFKSSIIKCHPHYLGLLSTGADYLREPLLLADEIYQIYLDTGFLYHKPQHLAPAISSSVQTGKLILLRGSNPLQSSPMSGLGEYTVEPTQTTRYYNNLSEMYRLHLPFVDLLAECVQSANWQTAFFPEDAEFLSHTNFRISYWMKKEDKNTTLSLMRVPLEVGHTYYLYRKQQGIWQWNQLPSWRTNLFWGQREVPEWLALATGILLYNDKFPPIYTSFDGNLVTVICPYLLPPAEEAFFKLYSWPMPDTGLNTFKQRIVRQMAAPLYLLFKAVMEHIGYRFEEDA